MKEVPYKQQFFENVDDFIYTSKMYVESIKNKVNRELVFDGDTTTANNINPSVGLNGQNKMSEPIGRIQFNNSSTIDGVCRMFRVKNGASYYKYDTCKGGYTTKYSKELIPLFNTVEEASKDNEYTKLHTHRNNNRNTLYGNVTCLIGYMDPVFEYGDNKEENGEHWWSRCIFVYYSPAKFKEIMKNRKIDAGSNDMCPCAICDVAKDSGLGEKSIKDIGIFSEDNRGESAQRIQGNASDGEQDLNIYAACKYNGDVYVYVEVKYHRWYQDKDIWAIAQGFKTNYRCITYVASGWTRLSQICNSDNFTVYVRMNDDPNAYSENINGDIESSEVFDTEHFAELFGTATSTSNKISPYINVNSIIGLPFSFLPNTDVRYGEFENGITLNGKATYGSQYMENIIQDMPIAVIRPGTPSRDGSRPSAMLQAIKSAALSAITGEKIDTKSIISSAFTSWISNDYERFYMFTSEYNKYIQYVNTLCHMFAMYLGIDKVKMYDYSDTTYGSYDDTLTVIDNSNNEFTKQFGSSPAVFCYYEPESGLQTDFNTQTTQASIQGTINENVDQFRQYKFFGEALGISSSTGVFKDVFGNGSIGATVQELMSSLKIVGEGIGSVILGNNISLPEIWSDSDTSSSFEIKIKLASPYGDTESIFLHVLRPLARLMALCIPHQTSANSYTSPFMVQAFSKGQFNCQLGIVTSMTITRGGEGGESHSVHHIPTEIEVTLTIEDLYEKITLSNEYVNGTLFNSLNPILFKRAIGLLVNNIGLMDFVASYSGFNLNAPSVDNQISLILNILKNRIKDNVTIGDNYGRMKLPSFERWLIDIYNDTTVRAQTFISS